MQTTVPSRAAHARVGIRTTSVMPFLSILGRSGMLPTSPCPDNPSVAVSPVHHAALVDVELLGCRCGDGSLDVSIRPRGPMPHDFRRRRRRLDDRSIRARLPRNTAMPAFFLNGDLNG